MLANTTGKSVTRRVGAAELFGHAVVSLEASELRHWAAVDHKKIRCPFKNNGGLCIKSGGVCLHVLLGKSRSGAVALQGMLVTSCPNRFLEGHKVFR